MNLSGGISRARLSGPAVAVAFAVLLVFAGYTLMDGAYLMSNACFDDTGQIVCPAKGPDRLRPLPAATVLLGLCAGLAALLAGGRARIPALITGFVLVTAALTASRLMVA